MLPRLRAMPAAPQTVALDIRHLTDDKRGVATIERALDRERERVERAAAATRA